MSTKSKKKRIPAIKETYQTTITYECPVRGMVTEIIKVNKYPSGEEIFSGDFVDVDSLSTKEDEEE